MRTLVFLFFSWLHLTGFAMENEKIVYGYVEHATLVEKKLTLSAKLDTGAKSASLNAINIKKTEINGKPFLNFHVPSKEGDIFFQCEYVGNVKIKLRSDEKHLESVLRKSIQRPVVLMKIKIGNKERVIRVNLTNRKRFLYPLLLGRDAIIAFDGIVDPKRKYTILNQFHSHG